MQSHFNASISCSRLCIECCNWNQNLNGLCTCERSNENGNTKHEKKTIKSDDIVFLTSWMHILIVEPSPPISYWFNDRWANGSLPVVMHSSSSSNVINSYWNKIEMIFFFEEHSIRVFQHVPATFWAKHRFPRQFAHRCKGWRNQLLLHIRTHLLFSAYISMSGLEQCSLERWTPI